MKTLFITKDVGAISIDNGTIRAGERKIPLKLIDGVIVTEDVNINSKTLIKLSKEGISALFVSRDNKSFALTLPQVAKNSDLKAMQYRAMDRKVEIARDILFRKFETHAMSLDETDSSIDISEYVQALKSAKSIDELLGIEGRFAKAYFDRYFELFPKLLCKGYRSKNPPQDPVNAILSFIYTLFYNQLTAKLYMRGFEPSISYLHTPFRSHYALSSDILEMFRARINLFVAELFLKKYFFEIGDFSVKDGVYLKSEKRRELWSLLGAFLGGMETEVNQTMAWLRREITNLEE